MKKQSVLYTWMLEFALVLALMVLMCVTLTYSARQTLLTEYEEITASQQEKTEIALDACFSTLRSQGLELIGDSTVKSFAYLTSPYRGDNYSLVLIQNQLKNLSLSGAADDTLIYFQNIGKAITDLTILNREACALQLFDAADGDALEQFDRLVSTPSLNRLAVVPGSDGASVLMLTSIPMAGYATRAVVIQRLNAQTLQEIIDAQTVLADATTVLIEPGGSAVCWTGDAQLAEHLAAQYPQLDAVNRLAVGSEEYWLRQKKLDSVGWTLVTAGTMQAVVRKSDWVWRQAFVFCAVFLVLGLLASAFIIYRNYKPIKDLTDRIPLDGTETASNEYERIDSAFQAVQNDLENLKLMQRRQRAVLQREWLENALAYETVGSQPREAEFLVSLGIRPCGEWFQLVLLRNEDAADLLNVLPEEGGRVVLTRPHGTTVLCLLAADRAALSALASQLSCLLDENGMDFLCSAPYHDFGQLHPAFLQLCEQADAASGVSGSYTAMRVTLSRTDDILKLVFSGQDGEACRLLRQAVSHSFAGRPFPVYLARMYYTDFLLQLLNAVPGDENCAEVQQAVIGTSRALQRAVTQAEMLELTGTLLEAVASKYRPLPEEAQPDFLDRITRCVRRHFREHDFNVSRMADLLGVSVPYLSKYFKEHTGVNLLSYLNSMRIDYAKQLIAEQRLSVAAAADRAGFENINTFIRLFKKYVGDTPGNYSKR